MSRRTPLMLIVACAVAGAASAVWALDARVERLTLATRIGISAGPATSAVRTVVVLGGAGSESQAPVPVSPGGS